MQSGEVPFKGTTESSAIPDAPVPDAIDVEALMDRVRKAVAEKRRAGIYRDDDWAVERPYDMGSTPAARDNLTLLRASAQVDLDGEPIQSHRPVAGALVKTAKRFTRYWVRKYTDSLFLRQSAFNAETVNTLTLLRSEIEELKAEVARLRAAAEDK